MHVFGPVVEDLHAVLLLVLLALNWLCMVLAIELLVMTGEGKNKLERKF